MILNGAVPLSIDLVQLNQELVCCFEPVDQPRLGLEHGRRVIGKRLGDFPALADSLANAADAQSHNTGMGSLLAP